MSRTTIILLTVATLMFSSCGIYGTYHHDSPYATDEATTDTLATIPWQQMFADANLQALIQRGLEQNADLSVARLRTDEAQALLTSARLGYLPTLNFAPEASASSFNGSTASSYTLGFTARWELDIFGRATNARRGALAALEASDAYRQAVQTRLIATIAEQYYTLQLLDKQLSISQQTIESWTNSITTLEALKSAGRTNDAAVLQAKAQKLALEGDVCTLQQQIGAVENALRSLLLDPTLSITRSSLDEATLPEVCNGGVALRQLENRPDVLQAEARLKEAFYATNAARADLYPTLTLGGLLGWTNSYGGVVVNPAQMLLQASGSLLQPIFNQGANRAKLQVSKAQQKEARLQWVQTLVDAGGEVNNALTQLQTAQQRIALDTAQVSTLQQAVEKVSLLMQYGSTSYLEVLTAQQSLLAAQRTLADDQFARLQALVNLYHTLGGGR